MVDFVSKLVSADTIVSIVETIEQKIPGWWYSVYQKFDGLIEIRGGPSLESPDGLSRRYAMTKDGDSGFTFDIDIDNPEIVTEVCVKLTEVKKHSLDLMSTIVSDVPPQTGLPRIHSIEDLEDLKINYTKSLATLHKTKDMGFDLYELHIGSCTISADCSIRGTLCGEDVSFECDVLDDGLGYSLWSSTADLLSETVDRFDPLFRTTASVPYSFGSDLHPGFAKIVEEIGEALEVIGKILMIGGKFVHWVGCLRKPLHKELADVSAAIDFYIAQPENMSDHERRKFFERKMGKIAKFEDWHTNPQGLPKDDTSNQTETVETRRTKLPDFIRNLFSPW